MFPPFSIVSGIFVVKLFEIQLLPVLSRAERDVMNRKAKNVQLLL